MADQRIAVVGGGIFGVTAAVRLARAGHQVVLWERAGDLLLGASRTNQRRLHRGYHYPRSPETAVTVAQGVAAFVEEYAAAVRTRQRHYVAISAHRSLTSAEKYVEFCDAMGLEYVEEYPPVLRRSAIDLCLRVREWGIDVDALRAACWRKLAGAGVSVRLNAHADRATTADFDHVVVATYAALDEFRAKAAGGRESYQFEVCEKPLVRLPAAYRGTSVVVLDGPFTCIDPVAADLFLVGNVVHAIHATAVGPFPLVPAHLWPALDRGLQQCPPDSRFAAFVADADRFFIGFRAAEHVGSLFTVRAVLPGLDETDARPTHVRRLDERTSRIFSGKITTCVEAAAEIVRLVEGSGTIDAAAHSRQPQPITVARSAGLRDRLVDVLRCP